MRIGIAIKEINHNAEFSILNNDINQITWLNNTTPISVEDIQAKISELENNGTSIENSKASGKQKLKDLGLDDDEIQALIGV
jgi:hypothetical protein